MQSMTPHNASGTLAQPRCTRSAAWLVAAALLSVLLFALLAGCATPDGVQQANRLAAAGKPEEALKLMEAAARTEPRRAEVYNAYITQRNALTAAYTRDADALRAQQQYDAAERQYRNALRLDPASDTAQSGLNALQRERRIEAAAAEAAATLQAGDLAGADARARAVLQESPSNRSARAVMKAVAEAQARNQVADQRLKGALARTVSLELRDAPLRNVFDILAREGGLNFILDKDVRTDARATIVVRDTNLDEVIKLLLLTNQLERRVLNENSLLIYPANAAKQREYQELVVRSFYLANADAKQTAAMIRAMVKTRDIFTDDKLNLVIMRDTPDAVRLAEQLVAAQDLPEPEVMLEVEVLEIASSLVRELGVNFPTQLSVGPSAPSTDPNVAAGLIQLPISGLRGFVANPLLLLNLRQQDGVSNLLANPRIRVRNREKAKVHIGERVPVITTTSTANVGVSSSVNYLETGLKLDVEPNVYLDDEVAIKVQLEVSNILEQLNVSGTVSYRLGTRNAATTLRLRDGETQVLAGLINNEDRRSVTRVPFLGEVPLLGRLFRNDNDQNIKSEIVLLITPRIIRNVARPDSVASQFSSGTEAVPGAPPIRLASATRMSMTPLATPAAAVAPAAATAASVASAAAAGQVYPLVVAAPAQVSAGDEFAMTFTLVSAQPVATRVELNFDARVLALVSGAPSAPAAPLPGALPIVSAAATQNDPGHAMFDIKAAGLAGTPPTSLQLRFKVIGTRSMTTRIGIETVSNGAPISAPDAHTLSIVAKPP